MVFEPDDRDLDLEDDLGREADFLELLRDDDFLEDLIEDDFGRDEDRDFTLLEEDRRDELSEVRLLIDLLFSSLEIES